METIDIYLVTRLAAARDFTETVFGLSVVLVLAWLLGRFIEKFVLDGVNDRDAVLIKGLVRKAKPLAVTAALLAAAAFLALPFMPTSKDVSMMVLNKVVADSGIKVLQVDATGNIAPAAKSH